MAEQLERQGVIDAPIGFILDAGPIQHWLVTLEKPNTGQKGEFGRVTDKSVIVECRREDVEDTVIMEEGYVIANIQDWDELREEHLHRTIEWIFR